jgi:hypothetical protein
MKESRVVGVENAGDADPAHHQRGSPDHLKALNSISWRLAPGRSTPPATKIATLPGRSAGGGLLGRRSPGTVEVRLTWTVYEEWEEKSR